jgi:hypothetical protein
MHEGATTLTDNRVGARRVRHVRAIRWARGARGAALMLMVAAAPIIIAIMLTGGDDRAATTSIPGPTEVLVRNFEGDGSTSTGVFVVSANWILKWQLDGLASDSIRISVRTTGGQESDSVFQEGLGEGEQAFAAGGAYRLVISSTGDWNIRVLQVSSPVGE